jgi:DHA2 family multidrug resistance protein
LNQLPFQGENHKWGVLVVVVLGSFMAILDNNIVNVALPKIMATFGATVDQIEWIITGYMIAFAISMPATSWLREVFNLKKVFIASLAVFCFGSALCGLAWSKDSLIAFRVIQALGGGSLMPTGLTLVTEVFPPQERGMAMGTWSIGAMVAPAIGPFLGGYLVDEVSWRSIFYINLPVGVIAILAAFFLLPSSRAGMSTRRFDVVGYLSFSVFLGFLLVALAQGQREGWDSDYILSCLSLSFLGLVAFIASNFLVKEPIIDLRLFANYNFLMANIVNFVRAVAIFGSMFLLPLFLQTILDYTALQTGIIVAPTAISVAIVSPLSGRITDRIGPRIPLFCGIVLVIYSLYLYKDISLNSDYWFFFWPQVMRGAGLGLLNAPIISAAMNAIRREQTAVASGLISVIMQVGGAFGVATLGTLLQRREFFHYAHSLQQMNNAFSPFFYQAQQTMQDLLLRAGQAPIEALAKGKSLLALWVQRQASVGAFGDAFFFAALLITIGIIPALLVRNIRFANLGKPVSPSE